MPARPAAAVVLDRAKLVLNWSKVMETTLNASVTTNTLFSPGPRIRYNNASNGSTSRRPATVQSSSVQRIQIQYIGCAHNTVHAQTKHAGVPHTRYTTPPTITARDTAEHYELKCMLPLSRLRSPQAAVATHIFSLFSFACLSKSRRRRRRSPPPRTRRSPPPRRPRLSQRRSSRSCMSVAVRSPASP